MTTANATTDAVEQIRDTDMVEAAWSADRGYVIAILERPTVSDASIFQTIDEADHLDMTGSVRVDTDFTFEGRERVAIHFEHVDRVEEGDA